MNALIFGGEIVTLLFLRANSYILLTADVDDVKALAYQMSKSQVLDQVKDIWRRSSESFKKQYNKDVRARADDAGSDKDGSTEQDEKSDLKTEKRKTVHELLDLGRNASVYLKTINKIIARL